MSLILLFTGCTIVRIDTSDINNTVDIVLSKNNNLYNKVGKGYQYYIPKGVVYLSTNAYNDILYSNNNNYYLYIDIISQFYGKEQPYQINEQAYISKEININDKSGYLEINIQEDGNYYVEFMYNYSKIETIVSKNDLKNTILYSSYILSTVKFNDNVIKLMLDDEFLVVEEQYDIFSSKIETDDFLKVEEVIQ